MIAGRSTQTPNRPTLRQPPGRRAVPHVISTMQQAIRATPVILRAPSRAPGSTGRSNLPVSTFKSPLSATRGLALRPRTRAANVRVSARTSAIPARRPVYTQKGSETWIFLYSKRQVSSLVVKASADGPSSTAAPGVFVPSIPPSTLPPPKVLEYAISAAVVKSQYTLSKSLVLAFMAVRTTRAVTQKPSLLRPVAFSYLSAATRSLTWDFPSPFRQGIQVSLGCLLMTTVAGGCAGIAAANPGMYKFVLGAVGLPTVRDGRGAECVARGFTATNGLLQPRVDTLSKGSPYAAIGSWQRPRIAVRQELWSIRSLVSGANIPPCPGCSTGARDDLLYRRRVRSGRICATLSAVLFSRRITRRYCLERTALPPSFQRLSPCFSSLRLFTGNIFVMTVGYLAKKVTVMVSPPVSRACTRAQICNASPTQTDAPAPPAPGRSTACATGAWRTWATASAPSQWCIWRTWRTSPPPSPGPRTPPPSQPAR